MYCFALHCSIVHNYPKNSCKILWENLKGPKDTVTAPHPGSRNFISSENQENFRSPKSQVEFRVVVGVRTSLQPLVGHFSFETTRNVRTCLHVTRDDRTISIKQIRTDNNAKHSQLQFNLNSGKTILPTR